VSDERTGRERPFTGAPRRMTYPLSRIHYGEWFEVEEEVEVQHVGNATTAWSYAMGTHKEIVRRRFRFPDPNQPEEP
jgi:hypothetical protein